MQHMCREATPSGNECTCFAFAVPFRHATSLLGLVWQSALFQVCVIGVTTRMDVTESMEKRLRSRFSQRQILFGPLRVEHAAALWRAALTLPSSAAAVPAKRSSSDAERARAPRDAAFVVQWNKGVLALCEDADHCCSAVRAIA